MAIIDGKYTITEQESRQQKAMALLEAQEAQAAYSALIAKVQEFSKILSGIQKAVSDLLRYSDGYDRVELLRIALEGTDEARSADILLALGRSLASALERKRTAASTLRLLGLAEE
jgi:hypothetical protein